MANSVFKKMSTTLLIYMLAIALLVSVHMINVGPEVSQAFLPLYQLHLFRLFPYLLMIIIALYLLKYISIYFIKRKLKDLIMTVFIWIIGLFVMSVAILLIGYILFNGLGAVSFDFIFGAEGIYPMIVTTLYLILLTMLCAVPIGVLTAVYLNEYASKSKVTAFIRLSIDSLAGIPSIVYGLFGLLFFVRMLAFGQSILSGALTLTILVLPTMIRSTEEALKAVPAIDKEGSYGLGANKFQTIMYISIPSARAGIINAIVLTIGRIVGESAPILLTVGLSSSVPTSIFSGGRSLSVHLYYLTNELIEANDYQKAFATATVLLGFIIILNILIKRLAKRLKGGK